MLGRKINWINWKSTVRNSLSENPQCDYSGYDILATIAMLDILHNSFPFVQRSAKLMIVELGSLPYLIIAIGTFVA